MKFKLWIAGGLSLMTVSAMAAFTTSEVGSGSYVAGGSVGDIIKNLLASDGYEAVELSDLTALATALGGGGASFDYSSNDSLAIFDVNNDGSISKSEFVDVLANMADISGISTAGNGKYAQAYATELGALTAPLDIASIQAAITSGNSYAVDAPQIGASAVSFVGTDSSHSASLSLLDGLGQSIDNGSGNAAHSLTASHSADDNASAKFAITDSGSLTLASGVGIQDLEPGTYNLAVTSVDTNIKSYGLSVTDNVTLTVSNERGCIINNGIASSDFSAGSGNITGARVTISGSHKNSDKLFVRTASSTVDNTTNDITYTNISGYSGISAVYDKSSGELDFTGTTTLANWIGLFKKVGYIFDSDNSTDNGTRSLIFSLSNRIPYNHTDGKVHYYDYIASANITFENALDAAKADNNTLFGMRGYLVTVTSQSEQDYIEPKLDGRGWMGACDRLGSATHQGLCDVFDNETTNLTGKPWDNSSGSRPLSDGEGYWYWVTGPERLDYIGHDTGNCNHTYIKNQTYGSGDSFDKANSEQDYTNFKSCEPNNYLNSSGGGPGENHLHFYSDGSWNDYGNVSGQIQGYIVEWGGMSGDPVVDLSQDKTYNIATEGQFCAH